MLTVTLYTRLDCHLCEQAKADLQALQEKVPHRLVELDIDSDAALNNSFALEIPVVEVGPYRLKAPFDRQDLLMTLGAASDRRAQLERVDADTLQARERRGKTITGSDKVSFWISRHYLALVNLFLLLYLGLPFLAPLLLKAGTNGPARIIYAIYRPLCHQFGFRSWYLSGEQAYYPHAAAHIEGMKTFEQVTGITDYNDPYRLAARAYTGDQTVGYKVALCQRDVAIYAALLFFSLVYSLTGRHIPPLHWALWVLIGMVPIGLDGLSQILSQFNLHALVAFLPYRESSPFLRTLTGFLFGFSTAWFGIPYAEESMQEIRQIFTRKFAVAQAANRELILTK